ncbi:hypothetical protein CDAR_276761 [Caerostris darwini]|uniref:Uncharacterized protein n=1 Tax=Caerostris darwini TaxID=1538125 RepID=A0AAV4RQJ7_9ARAC|nr:hypothetical protein CDAR_276761 [Caerostris darwini]
MISLQVAYGQIFRKILQPLRPTRLDLREPLEQSLSLTDNLSQESLEIEHHPPSFYGGPRHSKLHFLVEPWLPVRNCYPGRQIISFLELKGTKCFPCNVFYLNLPWQRWVKGGAGGWPRSGRSRFGPLARLGAVRCIWSILFQRDLRLFHRCLRTSS